MKIRPYQFDAVEGVFAQWERMILSTLIVMPTGTGKTITFREIVRRMLDECGGRALVIAHREELVRQAADKLMDAGLVCEIEMADQRADGSLLRRAQVIVGSIQTLTRRGRRFDPTEFSVVIVDEAHHYTSPSWRAFLRHLQHKNPKIRIVGVTATPDRSDNVGLGCLFESHAYVYELGQAIKDGWLCPIEQARPRVLDMDFSKADAASGDFSARELCNIMDSEQVLHPIAQGIVKYAEWRKTIVFAPPGFKQHETETFRISERLCEMINRYQPMSAAIISDRTPKDQRRLLLKDFAAGKIQYMVNVGVLTEGYDCPDIEMVAMARPTKSRSLYAQMVGRGTRTLPGVVDGIDTAEGRCSAIANSSKPQCRVLDFVGNAGRHKLISAADILAGDAPPEIVEAAKKVIEERGPMAVDEAVSIAKEKAEELRVKMAQEANRRKGIVADVSFDLVSVDPFDVLDVTPDRDIRRSQTEPASQSQMEVLAKFGVAPARQISRKEASRMISSCIERKRAGLCTVKQAQYLRRNGLAEDTLSTTFDEASKLIDAHRQQSAPRKFTGRRATVQEPVG